MIRTVLYIQTVLIRIRILDLDFYDPDPALQYLKHNGTIARWLINIIEFLLLKTSHSYGNLEKFVAIPGPCLYLACCTSIQSYAMLKNPDPD